VPHLHQVWASTGPPGSRAKCFRTCTGSPTTRDSTASRDIDAPDVAFRFLLQRWRPGACFFRGWIPGPHVPLSTLPRFPCKKLRMILGRYGSLTLWGVTLSFTTTRRFIPAHKEIAMPRPRSTDGGELVARTLKQFGVEVAFGLHGGHLDSL